MCGCRRTGAILGKRPRPNLAAKRRPIGRISVWDGEARANRAAPDDPQRVPRARDGRAPDVFRLRAWMPMREYRDIEEVDFAIVGTGAGGGTLACKLAEAGFSVVAFDAGPYWRPLEDFVSDERDQGGLYWTDERITGGADPVELGSNNSGRGGGGGAGGQTRVPRP